MPFNFSTSVSKRRLAIYFLILANTFWGAAPPIFKWALENIDVASFAFLRFAIATILIFPFAIKKLKIELRDIPKLILFAFLGISINITFFLFGLKFAPSINASIIASAGPIFLIPAAFFLLKEKPKRKIISGIILSLIGVIIILIKPFLNNGVDDSLAFLGNLFFFIAMLGMVGHTVIGRKMMKKYDPVTISFWSFLIGSITFLPQFIYSVSQRGFLPNIGFQGIIGLAYGIMFCSLIAYLFYFYALKHIDACEAGMFVYLDPVVSVIIAMPLLKEFPDTYYFLGASLVFAGIYFAENRINYHPFKLLKKIIP